MALHTKTGSGSPVSSVTPDYIGQHYIDTGSNTLYQAFGTANTDWSANMTAENVKKIVDDKSANYTIVAGDLGKVINVDATAGAITLTLTAAATLGDGFWCYVRKADSSANAVTIDPNAAETVNGAASFVLGVQYEQRLLVCDGAGWFMQSVITTPASATDNALVRFDGTTGKAVQNSAWTLDDSGVMNAADGVLQRPEIKDYAETRATPSSSAGTLTLDMTTANVFEVTLTENVTTLTISNPPASGKAGSLTLILKQDATGGRTFAWPASVKSAGGTDPTISGAANAIDIYTLLTTDAGTTWYVFTGGKAFS